MRYTVFVEYRNGATSTPQHSGVKDVAFRNFSEWVADKDLLLTAEACVITSSTGEVFRFDFRTPQPVPNFDEIPWPRRGARKKQKDAKTVSAFIAPPEEDFIKSLGEGSFTRGIRKAVSMLKLLEQQNKLKPLEKMATSQRE
ncbi:TPA: hypothetical protein ACSTLU_004361 [Serratia fonticola]